MFDYPITASVREAIRHFPQVSSLVSIPDAGRSKLQIVRLLTNIHYAQIKELLKFLNTHIPSSGNIGKRLVQQTDSFAFSQSLAELYLLAHLQRRDSIRAKASLADFPADKNYDIDFTTKESSARLEVYCPIDFYGCQFIERNLSILFKYLNIDVGFYIDLYLEFSATNGFYAYEVENSEKAVRDWLTCVNQQAARWLIDAQAGERRQFRGLSEHIQLTADLREVHDSSDVRCVSFSSPGKSTDTRLFFELGQPEDTANSQWGRKLLHKLKNRQCGDPEPNSLRVLVLDFSLADTGFPDFICWPRFTDRFAKTLDLLLARAGHPLPYDAVLPARLGKECCFGKIVALDPKREREIAEIASAALLDRPCSPARCEPVSWIDFIDEAAS